jgi:hypothetical protein
MRRLFVTLLLVLSAAIAAERPWQHVVVPPVAEVAKQFSSPPPEYAMTMWWFWNGPMTETGIERDLQEMKRHGVNAVLIWPYIGLEIQYLSPTWFERVRYAVQVAKQLGMRVWLEDEGGYPSGYVGGKIGRDRPQQRMRVLVRKRNEKGQWVVEPEYRSGPTRYVHNTGFAKDRSNPLYDALDAAATRDFLTDVHEQYKRYVGPEFGKTVMGIMGDEPSFPGVPYTEGIFEEFTRLKGYDPRPRLPQLFETSGEEASRFRADYWDVWTRLYRDNFFGEQADWCAREGIESLTHLCGEENMPELINLNGDFFRCFRRVQVPGVDAIWRQIWYGKTADYPKLASSAAHQFGRPRAFSEAFAVYGRGISLEQAKWVLDYHLVRGVNLLQAMEYLASTETYRTYFHPPAWQISPQWYMFSQLASYVNRLSYVLSVGRPSASIAIYYPTTSGWMRDFKPNETGLRVARELLESQRDFDFLDDDTLSTVVKVDAGALVNLSGQRYRTVIVPAVAVISEGALARLREFAESGGMVVFEGHAPERVAGKTYLHAAAGPSSYAWAVTGSYKSHLPKPDVVVEGALRPELKYVHRRLADGETYFLFNEGSRRLDLTLRVEGQGTPEVWDTLTARRTTPAGWTREGEYARVRIDLEPFETKLLVLAPAGGAPVAPRLKPSGSEIAIAGDWDIQIGGRIFNGALKSWADYGMPSYSGGARYRIKFQLPEAWYQRRERIWLDLGKVNYSTRVQVNGESPGTRAWSPFRFAVGQLLRAGENLLEVEVFNTRANELAGDPARMKEIEAKGWLKNSYVRTYQKFDLEMTASGLFGPVRLVEYVAAE